MNGEASVPSFAEQPGPRGRDYGTDEYAGLYISYGLVPTPFPYRMQENYSRELYDNEEDVIILENEYLRATFSLTTAESLHLCSTRRRARSFSSPIP